jgi:hypothetical protein
MTDTIEQQREETVPAELPADTAAPAPADSWDEVQSLLDDFDRQTATPEPDNATEQGAGENGAAVSDNELDKLLADLSAPSADRQRITDLEGELSSVRAAELDRQSRADFEGFSKKLQATLGPNVDEQFSRTNLLAMAAENPALEAAWRYRNLTDAERRAAGLEFQQLEVLYHRAQQAPDDPRKAQALAALEQRGQQLGLMMNAHKILNNTWREVQKRASKVAPAIDEQATADHAAVAFAVREASSGDLPEPQVDLGKLSDVEFRKHLRDKYNISGF